MVKMTTSDPSLQPKRKRRTKAEIEAERQAQMRAEADKPIDPLVWVLLGAAILFIAFFAWVDPVTLAESGNNPSIFQYIPAILARMIGETPAAIVLTVLGAVPLLWGIVGWLRKRLDGGEAS
jgi:hypothetical protein